MFADAWYLHFFVGLSFGKFSGLAQCWSDVDVTDLGRSHDVSSRVGPGPLPKNGVWSAEPSPMKIHDCFSSLYLSICSEMVPRSCSWTPCLLAEKTKWNMIKTDWKNARNGPWSCADTVMFLELITISHIDLIWFDSSSQFWDPKTNQWILFKNVFLMISLLCEALLKHQTPGRRKGFVIPQPAESHEAGWISLEDPWWDGSWWLKTPEKLVGFGGSFGVNEEMKHALLEETCSKGSESRSKCLPGSCPSFLVEHPCCVL